MVAALDALAGKHGLDRSAMIRRLLIEGSQRLATHERAQRAKERAAAMRKKVYEEQQEIVTDVLHEAEPELVARSSGFGSRSRRPRPLSAEEIRAVADRAERRGK
jgi:hypothetical protein